MSQIQPVTNDIFEETSHLPSATHQHSVLETLILPENFEEFLGVAYRRFLRTKRRELLRQALLYATPRDGLRLEVFFIRVYSALETLIALTLRGQRNAGIIPKRDWGLILKDQKAVLKKHRTLIKHPEKRDILLGKLANHINRPTLFAAYLRFCEIYDVKTDDLWTVGGSDRQVGLLLSGIRNRLVHRGYLNQRERQSLVIASIHLGWTLNDLS